jgi:hypothetical protein
MRATPGTVDPIALGEGQNGSSNQVGRSFEVAVGMSHRVGTAVTAWAVQLGSKQERCSDIGMIRDRDG